MNTSLKQWELELLNQRYFIESGYRHIFLDVLNPTAGTAGYKEYERVMRQYLFSKIFGSSDNIALL